MAESLTIPLGEPANKGEDFAYLKQEGLKLIQQLARDILTDYNEHDHRRDHARTAHAMP